MTSKIKRRKAIEDYINERGFVLTIDLAKTFNLTPQTVRRHTQFLVDNDLIIKTHGGVHKKDLQTTFLNPSCKKVTTDSSFRIDSISLIGFEGLQSDSNYISKVKKFLRKNSRVDGNTPIFSGGLK